MEENAQVKVSAIIVAAGASRRMGFDKLSYRLPGGKTVLETSVAAFAARPFVSEQVITDALAEAEAMGAAAPAVAVKDTIKIANDGAVVQTPDRAALFGVQAPQ